MFQLFSSGWIFFNVAMDVCRSCRSFRPTPWVSVLQAINGLESSIGKGSDNL